MTNLLTTLHIIKRLAITPTSAADLMQEHSISLPTVKRLIAEARHLGAVIQSRKAGTGFVYRLDNPQAIEVRLHRWLELETVRNLTPETKPEVQHHAAQALATLRRAVALLQRIADGEGTETLIPTVQDHLSAASSILATIKE